LRSMRKFREKAGDAPWTGSSPFGTNERLFVTDGANEMCAGPI